MKTNSAWSHLHEKKKLRDWNCFIFTTAPQPLYTQCYVTDAL